MPVTLARLITYQAWNEFLAQTTSDEVIPLIELPVAEGEAFMLHLFVLAKTPDGENAAFYENDGLFAREVGQNVRIAAGPVGFQTMSGDFTPQNPDVQWTVDTGTQSAVINLEGLSGVPLEWVAQVLVMRRV